MRYPFFLLSHIIVNLTTPSCKLFCFMLKYPLFSCLIAPSTKTGAHLPAVRLMRDCRFCRCRHCRPRSYTHIRQAGWSVPHKSYHAQLFSHSYFCDILLLTERDSSLCTEQTQVRGCFHENFKNESSTAYNEFHPDRVGCRSVFFSYSPFYRNGNNAYRSSNCGRRVLVWPLDRDAHRRSD